MVTITGEYQGELHCFALHRPSGNNSTTDASQTDPGRVDTLPPPGLVSTTISRAMTPRAFQADRRLIAGLAGMGFEVSKAMSTDALRRIVRLVTRFRVSNPECPWSPGTPERTVPTGLAHQDLPSAIEQALTFHRAATPALQAGLVRA